MNGAIFGIQINKNLSISDRLLLDRLEKLNLFIFAVGLTIKLVTL